MGAFFLALKKPGHEDSIHKAEVCLSKQGFAEPRKIDTPDFSLRVYDKQESAQDNFYYLDDKNFSFSNGLFFYKGLTALPALEKLLQDFDRENIDWSEIYGNFLVCVRKNGTTTLLTDRLGVYHVYHDESLSFFSNSFLALCECADRLSINKQSVYEYAFEGAVFNNRTLFREIATLGGDFLVDIHHGRAELNKLEQPIPLEIQQGDFAFHVGNNIDALRKYFSILERNFGNNIGTALSAGYDTRLLLALCREQESTPYLYVYGKDQSADVKIAKLISEKEGLALEHIDKSKKPMLSKNEFAQTIENNFWFFDGYPPDSFFDDGSDLKTRHERYSRDLLILNGGGGGIYRNFNHIPNHRYSNRQYLWMLYSQFDPEFCTPEFDSEEYYNNLGDAIHSSLGHDRNVLERNEIEALFIRLRFRYWLGRNTSINLRLGQALTPFVDRNITLQSNVIPVKYKSHGYFQASLIKEASAELAQYPSEYGHDFYSQVPLKRKIKDLGTYLRPPLVRRLSYRVKHRIRGKFARSYYLDADYLEQFMDPTLPHASQFLLTEKFSDELMFKRACSFEYLVQQYRNKITT